MLLVGIDEAGYGPLLGPLVISTVAMKLPDELTGLSLWQLLSGGLTDRPSSAKGRFVVADSKKIYHGHQGNIRELEKSALGAVFLAHGTFPDHLASLLSMISLESEPHLMHRWYCHQPFTLPHQASLDGLRLAAGVLSRELASIDAKIVAVKSVPLVEKKYNHFVQEIKNKSEILFSQTVRLIHEVLNGGFSEKNIRICVDKQGGKDKYVRSLLRMFPGVELSVVKEGPDESEYLMKDGERQIRLSFSKKGESQHLLIAWASIVSKYLREIFMMQFNRFWSAQNPTLTPTAGYWEDGQRFMKDIDPLLKKLNISAAELIRQL